MYFGQDQCGEWIVVLHGRLTVGLRLEEEEYEQNQSQSTFLATVIKFIVTSNLKM